MPVRPVCLTREERREKQNLGFVREILARIPGFVTDDSSCYHCYHCEVGPAGNQGNFPIYGGTKTAGGADSGAVVSPESRTQIFR